MLILGLDFETTGLLPEKDTITEAGAVLWDTESKSPLILYNKFVDGKVLIPKEITELTGITQDMVSKYGEGESQIALELISLIEKAEAVCVHNKNFDLQFFNILCERNDLHPPEKLWIDSCSDVPYPASITTRKLTHLAAEHGFVNPFPHRALTDVLTMLQVISKYPAETIMEYAKSPSVTLLAKTTYEERELPKARGYRWNGDIKKWTKVIKEFQLAEEEKNAPFPIEVRRE
jgi:DNA polymerase-3 subunit epsilon